MCYALAGACAIQYVAIYRDRAGKSMPSSTMCMCSHVRLLPPLSEAPARAPQPELCAAPATRDEQ